MDFFLEKKLSPEREGNLGEISRAGRANRRLETGNRTGLELESRSRSKRTQPRTRCVPLAIRSDGPRRLSYCPRAPVYLDHNLSYSPCFQWRHSFLRKIIARESLFVSEGLSLLFHYSSTISQSVTKCIHRDKPSARSRPAIDTRARFEISLEFLLSPNRSHILRTNGFMRRNDNPRPPLKATAFLIPLIPFAFQS